MVAQPERSPREAANNTQGALAPVWAFPRKVATVVLDAWPPFDA